MQTRFVAPAAFAAVFAFAPPAHSDDAAAPDLAATPPSARCAEAAHDAFRPEAELRSMVETFLHYRIARIFVDGSCYAVLASDRRGTRYAVRFRGRDLTMVSRYVVTAAPLAAAASER